MGPSGSGKSSLLRAVIGLQRPLAAQSKNEFAPAEVGILFQDDALLPWKTARDNVALGLIFNGMERGKALEQADLWLTRLGLVGFGHRFPRHLSGGQRKRVALAGAGDGAEVAADGRAVRVARRHRAGPHHPGRRRAGRARGDQRAAGHPRPREAIGLSDVVYLLSQSRARVIEDYAVPIPRPRDPVRARTNPAFAPLFNGIWTDLSRQVDREQAEAAE